MPSIQPVPVDKEVFGMAYGENPLQQMDLFIPAGFTNDSPLVVLVHGGGWEAGDKYEIYNYKLLIQENLPNVAVLNVNYTLCLPGIPIIEEQVADIQTAVNTYKEKFPMWNGKLIVLGYSAGAHLVTLLATAYANVFPVDGIVNLLGHVDFTIPNYVNSNLTNNYLQNVFGTTSYSQNQTLWTERSPITYVNENTPAILSVYCGLDQLVPAIQGERFHEQLNQLQVDNEYLFFPNENHFDWTQETGEEINQGIIDFLKRF